MAGDDDPLTGRRTLTRTAYADDAKLRARLAIYRHAERPADPGRRTAAVDWDGTQVVADIGCGNGLDLRRLLERNLCRRVVGVDLSAGMLRTLRGLEPERLRLVQGDAQHLPLGTGSVDVALAMHMLYHVPDRRAAVAELRRIVRPSGTLLASTNAAGSLAEIWRQFDEAVADQLGHPVGTAPPLGFTTETGAADLRTEFDDVTLHPHEFGLVFTEPDPVLAYVDSARDAVLALVGEEFDYDRALAGLADRVQAVIGADGRFRAVNRGGVFVCR